MRESDYYPERLPISLRNDTDYGISTYQKADCGKEVKFKSNFQRSHSQQERMKAARRPLLMQAKDFHWTFVEEGLKLSFYLPAGSYATALVRELVNIKEEE